MASSSTTDYRLALREVISNTGEGVHVRDALGSKTITALYFSAQWCGPCKAFTPKLIEFYRAHHRDMEVVFVSSDSSADKFKAYFKTMPWLAIPFENDDQIAMLMKAFRVRSIPTLLLFNAAGELLSANGIDLITSHPEGFPWHTRKPKTE
jgi:nucleoredoxin